jgi:hydrogenase/urease accessory protein HupE
MIFKNSLLNIFSLLINAVLLIKVLFFTLASNAHSHEVSPAVAAILQNQDSIQLEIRLNLEALLSDIDLSNISNTDQADQTEEYDFYRGRSVTELKSDFSKIWPSLANEIKVKQDDVFAVLKLEKIMVEEQENFDYPRFSILTITTNIKPLKPFNFQWSKSFGEIVIREEGEGNVFTQYLEAGVVSDEILLSQQSKQRFSDIFIDYIPVGFAHILPKGLDHILFVIGMFFLSTKLSSLFWQITFFTLAHSVTLAMASLGVIKVSASIVEPLIAASIVYLAIENFYSNALTIRRSIVILCFGLLHGLGFASVLADFGLPIHHFIPALIGFNVGVELGQILIILILFSAISYWFKKKTWYRKLIALPFSFVIGLVGLFWFFERII